MEQKTINVFLASSSELREDRVAFRDFIRHLDNIYEEQGIRIKLFIWENFDAAFCGGRTQYDYNNLIRTSDIFIALFYQTVGNFTIAELEVAIEEFRKKGYPKVFVFCKALEKSESETPKLKAFKDRLNAMGFFWTIYSSQDSLFLHFLQQLLMVNADGLSNLKVKDGTVKLWDMDVVKMSNLPFAADNKDYQRISAELSTLPNEIDSARKFLEEHPDNEYMQGELQKKLDRYNNLKEEFAQLQQTLFETSQRIATMQRENLSDKLRRATEAFESGKLEKANALLDEIDIEADSHYANLDQNREQIHQDIEAFSLRAKTIMADMNIPIEERIKEVHAIYAKADQWAKDSALPDDKFDGLLDDYSSFLYKYGKYKEAEPVYLCLISIREKVLGKEHPDTATSYNNIGAVYDDQGDYTKALEYYFKALDIREKVLGKEHPDIAKSYNNIGETYHNLGDYPKALEYLQMALDIREKVLGKEHPDTATSYNNIGAVYDDLGDYTKALEYYFKALNIREKAQGMEHPDTATSYNNIGMVYDSQGNYPKALEYHFKALDIREKGLGMEHPDTATSYNNIGMVYDSQGNYPKALEYYSKALDIYEKVLGKEHPYTAMSYNNIAGGYYRQGDYIKALEYYNKALDIREKALGKEHPYTGSSYNNIGAIYRSIGDYQKALEYYQKALDIQEKVFGKEHPNIATNYNNIGMVFYYLGDYNKALGYYHKSLNILLRVLGKDHPTIKVVMNNIKYIKDFIANQPKIN